jgi:hypothetical protein
METATYQRSTISKILNNVQSGLDTPAANGSLDIHDLSSSFTQNEDDVEAKVRSAISDRFSCVEWPDQLKGHPIQSSDDRIGTAVWMVEGEALAALTYKVEAWGVGFYLNQVDFHRALQYDTYLPAEAFSDESLGESLDMVAKQFHIVRERLSDTISRLDTLRHHADI